jgi:Raf kinase inhibitor-like YbhB/YbcL family protein
MGFALSKIELTSTAFEPLGRIPKRNTGEGQDLSPPLAWSNVPSGVQSFALICHDPDAPLVAKGAYGFVHWVLYNIPRSTASLGEGTKLHTSGQNSFGKSGYGGPMPPEGHGVHHYYFWLLALNARTELKSGLSLPELLEEIESNLIGMNRLVGTYSRPR